jgi:hypothetical protein
LGCCPLRREVTVHAVIGKVSIETGREAEATEHLKTNVVPRVKDAPGVVAGYWLAPQDGHGLGITLFESEEAARQGAEMAQNAPRPDFVTFDSIEVHQVIAQF